MDQAEGAGLGPEVCIGGEVAGGFAVSLGDVAEGSLVSPVFASSEGDSEAQATSATHSERAMLEP